MNNQSITLNVHDFGGKYIEQLKPFIKTLPISAVLICFSYYDKGSFDRALNYV